MRTPPSLPVRPNPSIGPAAVGSVSLACGACTGLGLVYALYSDQRFGAAGAKFTTTFARRGLIAEHGISYTLPRLVGLSAALDLLMPARKIDADEALRLGLVDRVVPADELMTTVYANPRDLADNVSPRAMAVIKRQLWAVGTQTPQEAINIGNHEMTASYSTEDFQDGVVHFVEKRPAAFTGR